MFKPVFKHSISTKNKLNCVYRQQCLVLQETVLTEFTVKPKLVNLGFGETTSNIEGDYDIYVKVPNFLQTSYYQFLRYYTIRTTSFFNPHLRSSAKENKKENLLKYEIILTAHAFLHLSENRATYKLVVLI